MRVGIVGAGVAGLAAARTLRQHGHEPVIFEKSCHVGGRASTRRLHGFTYDTGATSVAPRGLSIEHVIREELAHEDLVRIERPIYTLRGFRVEAGDPLKMRIDRYTWALGNQTLCERLAEGIAVRLNTPIEKLDAQKLTLNDEAFDALILTPPIPQTRALLGDHPVQGLLAQVTYRACLSVFLGFERRLPPLPYHALIEPDQRHPLTWVSVESVKAPGRAPNGFEGLVAQLAPEYSRQHLEAEEAVIVRDTLEYVERLYGKDLGAPVASDVKRWKYSQPESIAMFDRVNPAGSRLLIAGDGVLGARVELAYETGVMAAQRLVQG